MYHTGIFSQSIATNELFINPNFQNYTMQNGLLSNYINDSELDDKGYIWIATSNGCMRYSGNKFISFQQQSENQNHQMPSNNILDLCKGKNGDMFINTNNGLVKYDFKRNKIIVFKQKYHGWGKVLYTRKNQVYISTWLGIQQYLLINDSLVLIKDYKETSQNTVFNLQNINDFIWACAEDIQSSFKIKEKLEYISFKVDGKKRQLNSICKLNNNQLLFTTENYGVLLFNIQKNEFSTIIEKKKVSNSITCIQVYSIENQDTFILLGTSNNGFYTYNLRTKEIANILNIYGQINGVLSNQINNILIDRNNGIWLSTDKGLSFFHPSIQKTSTYFLGQKGFENILINCVESTKENKFIIGTENRGLLIFDRKKNLKTNIKLSPKINKINSILSIDNNEYLIGTEGGVFKYNNKKNTSTILKIDNLPMVLGVTKICKLSNNMIGLCTFNGAWVYDITNNKTIFKENYINNPIQSKRYCKDLLIIGNNIWILRLFNGINIYNLITHKYSDITPNILTNKAIDYYNFTKNITKVFISSNTGIIEIDIKNNSNYKLYKSKNGLEGNQICQVLYHHKMNKLYYSTYVGVFEYKFSKNESKPLFNYENFSQKWYNQFSLLNDDQLLTTISNYFIAYNLNSKFNNYSLPSLQIRNTFVNEKQYSTNLQNLDLKYFENNITIHLDALTYIEPDKNKWYYKIKDYNNEWIVCRNGDINIYNISPGDYSIELYSMNNEGLKSEIKTILNFQIQKAFYNTQFFYLYIGIFIFGIFYLFFKLKTKQQTKLQNVRNQISRDLHDELGANVSAINIMSQLLNKKKESDSKDKELTTKISHYSIEVSDTINDIIWNINPKFNTIEELIKKMIYFATNILESTGIILILNLPTKVEDIKILSEIKFNLYLIFKEIVNNTAKHSKAKNVKISVKTSKYFFEFEIIDNGIGFNLTTETQRNGILNMKDRAQNIDATLNINTEINKGTKTHLLYKLK